MPIRAGAGSQNAPLLRVLRWSKRERACPERAQRVEWARIRIRTDPLRSFKQDWIDSYDFRKPLQIEDPAGRSGGGPAGDATRGVRWHQYSGAYLGVQSATSLPRWPATSSSTTSAAWWCWPSITTVPRAKPESGITTSSPRWWAHNPQHPADVGWMNGMAAGSVANVGIVRDGRPEGVKPPWATARTG